MPKRINLKGQVFGDWYVDSYVGNSVWKCVNSFTNESKDIHSYDLRTKYLNGKKEYKPKKHEDLTDQRFGEWKALEYAGNGRWLCECSCENHTRSYVSITDLKRGNSTNCGCKKLEKILIDMKGITNGEWTVLDYAGNGYWRCQCSCGEIKNILGQRIRRDRLTHCGNLDKHPEYRKFKDDLTGREFGLWKVLGPSRTNYWKCECQCKNKTIRDVLGYDLKNGYSRSCGCNKEVARVNTLYDRYGDTNTTRIDNPRDRWQIEATSSKEKLEDIISSFDHTPTVNELSELLDINDTSVIKALRKFGLDDHIVNVQNGISDIETSLVNYIKSLNIDVETNNRTILNGKELDIYIPSKRIAIEFNGNYWHSTLYKSVNYHRDKTIECIKKGIHLIHIFEYEWRTPEICNRIKHYLKSLLSEDNIKIYARKTEIKDVSAKDSKEFLDEYHIQGDAPASVRLGCYYNEELVGIMTFGTPRFNSEYQWELIRLCWKGNYKVVGGVNKIFKHFIKRYNPQSILSYCDLTKFDGNVYFGLGFSTDVKQLTKPNYVWVNTRDSSYLTRYQTQKQKLLDNGFGAFGNTEDEIMENLGYVKICNSGNLKFEYLRKEE